ncbi:MAG: hypothetical protein KC964_06980, partial [Candidatus Omnitrophica bacterium]|nr:hypothetical protein [Candidatus Omnitrophota bacterium]
MTSTLTFRLMLVGLILFSFPLSVWCQTDEEDFLAQIQSETQNAANAILYEDWSSGMVKSSSLLYSMKNHPDFLDIAETVTDSFSYLRPHEVRSRLALARDEAVGTFHGLNWLMVGLLSSSLNEHQKAADCFEKIQFNGDLTDSPYPYVLRGQELLAGGDLRQVTQAYEAAIRKASTDGGNLFRVRYEYTNNLLQSGFLDPALDRALVSLESEYPMERLWIREELVHYYW